MTSSETARWPWLAALAMLFSILLTSCETPTLVRGAGLRAYIAAVTVDGVRGQLNTGAPPPPGAGPSVTVPANTQTITGGSSAFNLVASAPVERVAVFVEGVGGHHLVFLPDLVTSAQAIITIGGLPPVLDFDIVFAVAGSDGVFGPYSTMSVSAIQAAGGDIQVSVTWDTPADVDLHVIEPGGVELYYGNPMGAGGELDIDANAACSVSSLTQENIGWAPGTAPLGTYIVRVDYWDACGATQTDYIVTVSLRPGTPSVPGLPGSGVQIFTGTFFGPGDQGGAGSGRTITNFVF